MILLSTMGLRDRWETLIEPCWLPPKGHSYYFSADGLGLFALWARKEKGLKASAEGAEISTGD
jgi:hypothetical protein